MPPPPSLRRVMGYQGAVRFFITWNSKRTGRITPLVLFPSPWPRITKKKEEVAAVHDSYSRTEKKNVC